MTLYDWPRFWCPRDGGSLLLDEGYPSSSAVQFKSVFPFAEINHIPCLALLGEPGIGKSAAIQSTYMTLQAEAGRDARERVHFIDLSPFGDESRLVKNPF